MDRISEVLESTLGNILNPVIKSLCRRCKSEKSKHPSKRERGRYMMESRAERALMRNEDENVSCVPNLCSVKQVWLERLKDINAIWEYKPGDVNIPKFVLSGKVSDFYFNSDTLHDPDIIGAMWEEYFSPSLFANRIQPDFFVTVRPFGLPFGEVFAKRVGVPVGSIEARNSSPCTHLPDDGATSLVVTDDIWSGGLVNRMLDELQSNNKPPPAAVLVIGNFSGLQSIRDIPIISLFERKVETYHFKESPFADIEGINLIDPRKEWSLLINRR